MLCGELPSYLESFDPPQSAPPHRICYCSATRGSSLEALAKTFLPMTVWPKLPCSPGRQKYSRSVRVSHPTGKTEKHPPLNPPSNRTQGFRVTQSILRRERPVGFPQPFAFGPATLGQHVCRRRRFLSCVRNHHRWVRHRFLRRLRLAVTGFPGETVCAAPHHECEEESEEGEFHSA